ncbi:hypothetical protein MTR67_012083 [Solanum verrucosum]|uniref:Integrase zinc-binding domain-containing protein n=1 Tax=Solanum verrucosum TaxID=315347 RepID=A0AAF0TJY1_SOLVR|nr:hypothetical protein MTR67_012083 [Solanum verrucosum]
MNVLYHPGKTNIVSDGLSRLPMGSVAHVEREMKELEKDNHRLACFRVCIMNLSNDGVIVQNGSKSSLATEVKEKQDNDPILLQLKGAVHQQKVEVFSQGGDDVLHYQGRLCVPNMGELRQQILTEAHKSRYSIHPGATKIYHDQREVFLLNDMKRHIADFLAKYPNCQQVKVEHQKPGGMTQEINIPTWKWEVINMDFITGLPRTRRHHDFIWVIEDIVTKSTHFLAIKTIYSREEYTKLYIHEIVRLHGVPLTISIDRQKRHDPQQDLLIVGWTTVCGPGLWIVAHNSHLLMPNDGLIGRTVGLRIAKSTWRVAEGSYFAFCSSVLSPEGKDQVGGKKEQSVNHREVSRSSTMSPNDPGHDDAEVVVDELNEVVVANIISNMCFRLARERGRKTKTTKLMACASGSDSIQGSSTPLKDKDDALETPRRPITRSQTKEFNDKLNGLQSLIQRFLIGEEELTPKGEELSKCYNYLVAQIQDQDEEF